MKWFELAPVLGVLYDNNVGRLIGNLAAGKTLTGFSIFVNSDGCAANCTRTFLDDVQLNPGAVPEPRTLALFGLGFSRCKRMT